MKCLVLDTNVPLSSAENIITLGQDPNVIVVIPEIVLAELDGKKQGFEEINYQAREAARILSSDHVEMVRTTYGYKAKMIVNGQEVWIVGLNAYTTDTSTYSANDQKIIETVKVLMDSVDIQDEVILMSTDYYMRIRAMAVGVKAIDLKIVDNTEKEFVKELVVHDEETFRSLHDTVITEVNPEHKVENYSYKFTCNITGQVKLATISNGLIKVLGKETEQSLRSQDCNPINAEQLLASRAIQDPSIDLVVIEGQAGSGKNIIALSNAIALMRKNKDKYKQIVYIRNPINDEERGEDIGFLSGNDEKYAMYLGPLEDTIDFLVRQKIKQKPGEKVAETEMRVQEGIEKMKSEYNISARITTGLRGATFHNSIVIWDEYQNSSQATAQKGLTRTGQWCKTIITGSQNQIDNKYITKYNNGFAVILDEIRNRTISTNLNMFAIELKKVVRSDMAMFAEKLFNRSKRY